MSTLSPISVTTQLATSVDPAPISVEQQEQRVADQQATNRIASTNASASEAETADRYSNASVVDLTNGFESRVSNNNKVFNIQERLPPGVTAGAEKVTDFKTTTSFVDRRGNKLGKDLRVKIKVPPKYLEGIAAPLSLHHGILFPYTPQIQFEVGADYGTSAPIHSNYTVYFYQRSKVNPISITGKFTVSNENDADILISTMHCLRSLTKMRFGSDVDRGAPPPVCRLNGHGSFMFDNVPVVIQNFRFEYPDAVDYFTYKKANSQGEFGSDTVSSVPVLSTISVTVLPVYSRNEMQQFSVTKYINGGFNGLGYL